LKAHETSVYLTGKPEHYSAQSFQADHVHILHLVILPMP